MKPNFSRRRFLRGTGVALALPWMESLSAATASNKPPVRFACVYFSNGVEPIHWWAKGQGAKMELGPAVQPMMPYREDINFLRGLYNHKAFVSTSPHLGRMPNMLSCATVSLDPADIRVGTTFDQVMAREIGSQTAVPSLALGIVRSTKPRCCTSSHNRWTRSRQWLPYFGQTRAMTLSEKASTSS